MPSHTSSTLRLPAACAAILLAVSCARSPLYYLETGMAKLRAGDYPAAAVLLQRAVNDMPSNATARANLAIAKWKQGQDEKAVSLFGEALMLSENDPALLAFTGRVFLDMNRLDDAREALAQAAQVQATAELLTTQAAIEIQDGNTAKGAAFLDEALALDPNYPAALYNAAALAANQGKLALAEQTYRRFLQGAGDPRVPAAPETIPAAPDQLSASAIAAAAAFLGLSEPGAPATPPPSRTPRRPATTTTTQGPSAVVPPRTPASPESPAIALVRDARAAIQKEDLDAAHILLSKAVRLDPRHADALWELCRLYDQNLDYPDRALELYQSFAARFPNDPRAATAAAAGRRLVDRLSVSTTTWPWENNPAEPNATAARGAFQDAIRYQEQKNWQSAIAFYKKALMLDPQFADAAFNLGLAYKSDGNFNLARDAFLYTLKVAPDTPMAHYMLGVTYRELGDPLRASAHLEKSLEFRPNYARAHYLLGVIYRDQRNESRAIEHLRRYVELAPHEEAAKKLKPWLDSLDAEN